MIDYKCELDSYSGPLDLLLYLIKKGEVEVYDIPMSVITTQYLERIELLKELNVELAGEFIVMAATLIEIKSRMMLPEIETIEDDLDDPRRELVRQLVEYRRFKEAAELLTHNALERGKQFQRHAERLPGDETKAAPQGAPGDISLWTLMDAFARVLRQTGGDATHHIVMDNVPQEEFMRRLEERAQDAGQLSFFCLFEKGGSRAVLVAMFLALLELIKTQILRAEQPDAFGDIVIRYIPPEERPPEESDESDPSNPSDTPPPQGE